MTDARAARRVTLLAMALLGVALSACVTAPERSPTTASAIPSGPPTTGGATRGGAATPSSAASASRAPSLTLAPPAAVDSRRVRVSASAAVPGEVGATGTLSVDVTSLAGDRIDDLVLRWPTELGQRVFLAPFMPSAARVREGGPNLVEPWTKWVEGPGELGEPAGTTSLGWGPLLPGATLHVELVATRRTAGPVEFDLQLLSGATAGAEAKAGDALLRDARGGPAQLRVSVP